MPKSIPQRMCTGCHEHRAKNELVRVVRSPEGEVSLDLTGRKNGRGAYICRSGECLKKARKQRALERALQQPISDELFEQMLAQIQEGSE
ncbi:MAG: YlxR family protein [Oscillospiraceae bacterium]|nr:YlxR family protein [Oscillospiraceae bacterium]